MKRACVALDALHQTQVQNMQIKGIGHKAHMEAYDHEFKEGEQGMVSGKFEHAMSKPSRKAGLTEKHYRAGKNGKLEPLKRNGR